jgi:hypothetical protein
MTDFIQAYTAVDKYIEDRYRIISTISDVVDPNTGDFDGQKIVVDYTLDAEQALFALLHLFGHTVQWNVDEKWRELGLRALARVSDEEMVPVHQYEKDATRYGIQALHESGITDMDQWASNWWFADWRWLSHFYKTGEQLSQLKVKEWMIEGDAELLTPLAIPDFTPRKFESRWAFATDKK